MVSVTSYCDNKDESHNERSPHSSSMAAINKTDYGRWWAVGSTEKVGRQNGEAAVQFYAAFGLGILVQLDSCSVMPFRG